eukprot:TRINITY_DN9915_c0_g4_i1.p1 TRINITY_DN9915_c0_g4~~TRINITY_DN9915_c0_g4_i1.p1  ORF type:complete len:898 (+),score=194.63 TRINITY_DN9915_c0_g4_i1:35-2728(+)
MASFMHFDGRGVDHKVSMAGSKRGLGRREKMESLRKQRAQREESRVHVDASVKIQSWVRGCRCRADVDAKLESGLGRLESVVEKLRHFSLASPASRSRLLPELAAAILCDTAAFTLLHKTVDPVLYFNRCLKLITAATLECLYVPELLAVVINPTCFTDSILFHALQEKCVSLNVFSHLVAPTEDVVKGVLQQGTSFTPGGFKSFVIHIFSRSLRVSSNTKQVTTAGKILGFDTLFDLSGATVLQMFKECCEEGLWAGGVLEGFSRVLPSFISDEPSLMTPLVDLFGEYLQHTSPAWVSKNIQTLYIMQPSFGRRAISAATKQGDLSHVCSFYTALLSKCSDNKAKTAVLTVLAFSDGFLRALWKDVGSRLDMGPIARAVKYEDHVVKPLYLFLLACGHFLDCSHIDELKDCLDLTDVTLKLINHGTRSIFHEASSVLVRDEMMSLLRKLHDWNGRKEFLKPQHWIVQAPFPWPTSIALDDWRAHHKGSPVYRTFLVLQNIPFTIPFDSRVLMFRSLVEQDINSLGLDMAWFGGQNATIRRDRVFEDGFRAITRMTPDELKMKARVAFISRDGVEEAGFGDGVFKEFLAELSKVAFNPAHGLFLETEANEVFPNPSSNEEHLYGEGHLERYRFLGRVLGKALYEGILIDLPLTKFFRNSLLERSNCMHDLSSLDPELHKNLLQLKTMLPDEVESVGLVFAVTVDRVGITKTIEFFPGGADTPVTDENKMRYIHMMSYFKLTQQISKQVTAMKEGLQEVVSPSWLRMFDSTELQVLLCGHDNAAPLDIDDWEENSVYGGGYSAGHNTIRMFWKVVREQFTPEQQRQLLKFATSVDRAPLLGFKYLHPKFCIHLGGEADRLPSASTCMCLLKLPPYANLPQLREKLSTAIQHNTGFELS